MVERLGRCTAVQEQKYGSIRMRPRCVKTIHIFIDIPSGEYINESAIHTKTMRVSLRIFMQ